MGSCSKDAFGSTKFHELIYLVDLGSVEVDVGSELGSKFLFGICLRKRNNLETHLFGKLDTQMTETLEHYEMSKNYRQ